MQCWVIIPGVWDSPRNKWSAWESKEKWRISEMVECHRDQNQEFLGPQMVVKSKGPNGTPGSSGQSRWRWNMIPLGQINDIWYMYNICIWYMFYLVIYFGVRLAPSHTHPKSSPFFQKWGDENQKEFSFINDFAHIPWEDTPNFPKTPQRKEILHKLLVKHPGYLPGRFHFAFQVVCLCHTFCRGLEPLWNSEPSHLAAV